MSKPGFTWITPVLCVENVAKSLEYYEQVLGFEISWKWSESEAFGISCDPSFACVTRGQCSLFLCEQGQGNPGSWNCLNVDTLEELEELFRQYTDSGAHIIEEPQDRSWGMREMLVADLDGNTFRLGCQLRDEC
jgi:uncharacterized glyoxalase superfamily protein PhnB